MLETIRIVDGEAPLLKYHQRRVDRSRRIYYAKAPAFRLSHVLDRLELPATGVHKLRLLYGTALESYSITPYRVRPVHTLRVVHADDLHYRRKYADRAAINQLFDLRKDCDDILIVQQGHVTDCSYANLAFYDGGQWHTPAWPLLPGARREYLIEQGVVRPSIIRLRDIHHFETARLFNSMMEWEEGPLLSVAAIRNDCLPGG